MSDQTLWETPWEGAVQVPFFAASDGSWTCSIRTQDGESRYLAGVRATLMCLAD
jgi:hypothetical protein